MEKPASRRGSLGSYRVPTSEVQLALTPPEPKAINTSPTPTPSRPGSADSAMWPDITRIAA